MEGSTGTLFNHQYPNGVGVIVQNVDRANGEITFYTTNRPDGHDEIILNRENEEFIRNDGQLQAIRELYYVEWEIKMENQPNTPLSSLPPGSPRGNNSNDDTIGNVSGKNSVNGGKRKSKSRARKSRSRKVKKTRGRK
jgi:hypothetical protein